MALICETVAATNMRDLRRQRDASAADLVELRLDGVTDLDVAGALQDRSKPVILTCRAAWEGGRFAGSEEERLRILGAAIGSDAEYVDLEWRTDRQRLPAIQSHRLVLSNHDFTGMPADLEARFESMRSSAAGGVVKVACAPGQARDLIRLHTLAASAGQRCVVIGMGAQGLVTRICPDLFRSEWTYGGVAAPGQLSVNDLVHLYRVRDQSPATRRFALTGKPLAHSASPAMHNAAFAAQGIDAVYVPIEADDPAAFLEVADALGVEGASVTAPLKTRWAAVGVALDDTAQAIGAANTLRRRDGAWSGRNFDVEGFLAPLRERAVPLRGARCVVVGAGGAARAAVWALCHEGARVEVSSRHAERAAALAAELGIVATSFPPPTGWDLLINATPAGTWPDVRSAPIPRSHVGGKAVYDLVYHPRQTQLLAWAREAGASVIGGLDMLVAQATKQFEYWIEQPAPEQVMWSAAEWFLETVDANEADHV
jgi:3-dehydroquinate dehydratase/shikimate dehydrogenase